jgi:hypothetical protein
MSVRRRWEGVIVDGAIIGSGAHTLRRSSLLRLSDIADLHQVTIRT